MSCFKRPINIFTDISTPVPNVNQQMSNLLLDSSTTPKGRSWPQDERGETALHRACRRGVKQEVQSLLKDGADGMARNKENDTPIHIACRGGHQHIVQMLLKHIGPKNIEIKGKWEESLLHAASAGGSEEVVTYLLKQGVNVLVEMKDEYGNAAIHYACRNNHVEVVKILLKHYSIEEKGEFDMTLLHKACSGGAMDVINYLITQGADIKARDKLGNKCIHRACRYNHLVVVKKILEYLELEWTEDVLHHEQKVGKEHGISLSKVERSSDQVN